MMLLSEEDPYLCCDLVIQFVYAIFIYFSLSTGTALLSVVAFPLGEFCIGSHHMINNIPKKEQNRLFYVALLTICLGIGGTRAIVCPVGAYSLREHGSQTRMSFFNW